MSDEVELPNEALERHEHALEHGAAHGKDRHATVMTLTIILLAMAGAVAGKLSAGSEIHYLSHHIERSDAWAEYQAKSTRQSMYEGLAELAATMPNASDPATAKAIADFKSRAAHMASDDSGSGKAQLALKAAHEEELRNRASERLEAFELVVGVIAVAIGLASASLLTPARTPRTILGGLGIAAGAAAAAYGLWTLVFVT